MIIAFALAPLSVLRKLHVGISQILRVSGAPFFFRPLAISLLLTCPDTSFPHQSSHKVYSQPQPLPFLLFPFLIFARRNKNVCLATNQHSLVAKLRALGVWDVSNSRVERNNRHISIRPPASRTREEESRRIEAERKRWKTF